jgi:hypothetical protein
VLKKILVGVLAVVFLLAGGALAASAVWAYSTFGMSGLMSFGAGRITPGPDARSILLDVDRFGATVPYLQDYGTTTLSVTTGERGDPSDTLFVGAASTEEVDAFVKGTPYSVAFKDGSDWRTRDVPGLTTPGLPRTESFWLAQSVGPRAAITVPPQRPLTLLIMHPSAIPTGSVMLSIDFTVRDASRWITGLAVAAAGLLLLGVVFLVILFRMRRHRGRHQGALGQGASA